MTAKPRKRTTPARSRERTVAEPPINPGQGDPPVDTPPRLPSPVPDPAPVVAPPVDSPQVTTTDFCDNHADVPAVLVTDFPWAVSQKFCRPCVPAQYAYLL